MVVQVLKKKKKLENIGGFKVWHKFWNIFVGTIFASKAKG